MGGGGVFGLLIAVHMYTSVFLLRSRWRVTLKRIRAGEAGSLTWLRLIQRVSAWALFFSAFLVLLSGLDWFKVGTGWLVPFASHVRYDVFLSVSIVVHSSVGLYFALIRRKAGLGFVIFIRAGGCMVLEPGRLADKDRGLWTLRREFESPPGY